MSSPFLSRLSVHMLYTILIFLVACKANAYRPFNNFSTRENSNTNMEVDQLLRPAHVYPKGVLIDSLLANRKDVKKDVNYTHPTIAQIEVLIKAFAPLVYFHGDEEFFPSSTTWFFNNGAQVFDPSPHGIINNGENLPRNGTIDDSFLDLPVDQSLKDNVKKGSLSDAVAYIHAKPGPVFTDIVIWLYYPFNGGSKFQVGPFTLNLKMIGEHVGDWEHISLRIENDSGALQSIYLSQHAKGEWIPADNFEYINGRPLVYASLHDHAHYHVPTRKIHFNAKDLVDPKDKQKLMREINRLYPNASSQIYFAFGPLDETEKSNHVFDILASPSSYEIVSIDNCSENIVPPSWLDYTGRWGPKITYAWKEVVFTVIDSLPLPLWVKIISRQIMLKLPAETYGEEGPEGPKMKANWNGDERI